MLTRHPWSIQEAIRSPRYFGHRLALALAFNNASGSKSWDFGLEWDNLHGSSDTDGWLPNLNVRSRKLSQVLKKRSSVVQLKRASTTTSNLLLLCIVRQLQYVLYFYIRCILASIKSFKTQQIRRYGNFFLIGFLGWKVFASIYLLFEPFFIVVASR